MAYENGLSMDDRATSLCQPDTLLPDQYLDTFRRKLHLEPEKKLLLAILEDAVACYQKYLFAHDSKGKAQFRDTESWIFHGGAVGVFAFDSVCELLGLEPNYLRRGLKQWQQRALAPRPPVRVMQLPPRRDQARRGPPVPTRPKRRLRRAAGR